MFFPSNEPIKRGHLFPGASDSTGNPYIAKLDAAGNPDLSFGAGGYQMISFGAYSFNVIETFPDSLGGFTLAVEAFTSATNRVRPGTIKLLPNGQADQSYGLGGYAFDNNMGDFYDLRCADLQTDGKIVFGGTFQSYNYPFVARLNANGTADSSFAGNGFMIHDFADNELMHDIHIASDGSILVSGWAIIFPQAQIYEAAGTIGKILPNGDADSTFGMSARVYLQPGWKNECVFGITEDAMGKILVGGAYFEGGPNLDTSGYFLSRLLPTGALDSSFGANGSIVEGPGKTTFNDLNMQMTMLADEKVILSGTDRNDVIRIARYGPGLKSSKIIVQ